MILYNNNGRYIAIYFSKWIGFKIWHVVVPIDWHETMISFGFGTLHWERQK